MLALRIYIFIARRQKLAREMSFGSQNCSLNQFWQQNSPEGLVWQLFLQILVRAGVNLGRGGPIME